MTQVASAGGRPGVADAAELVAYAQSRPIADTVGLLTTGNAVIPVPAGASQAKVYVSVLARVGVGASASGPSASVAEVQTITAGDATSGNFTASFQGQTTGNNAWNLVAPTLQTNLRAMPSIGATGVTCGGGPLNTTPITITFDDVTLRGDQPMITVATVDLAGGVDANSRLPVVTQTTKGATFLGYQEAGTQEVWTLAAGDAFLYLRADSGTGTYRVSWEG